MPLVHFLTKLALLCATLKVKVTFLEGSMLQIGLLLGNPQVTSRSWGGNDKRILTRISGSATFGAWKLGLQQLMIAS